MPKVYEFTAHAGNTIRHDTMEADSERQVRAWLRDQGMFPLEIKVQSKIRLSSVKDLKRAFTAVDAQPKKKIETAVVRKKVYLYTAVPLSGGDKFKGEMVAADDREVRLLLRERSLLPLRVRLKPFYYDFLPSAGQIADSVAADRQKNTVANTGLENLAERFLPKALARRKVPLKEMVFYTQQLSTMLAAGLAISQALQILSGNIQHRRLLKINADVQAKIFEGVSLTDAFADHEAYLPPIFVELIAIGEQSGNIEETTGRLSEYLEKTAEGRRKVKSAMTYPSVLLGLICLIVLGLMIFVVPTFIQLFKDFKLVLPLSTRVLLALSHYILTKWWTLPLFPLGIYVGFLWFSNTNLGKAWGDRLEYKIPLMGKLAYKVTMSRLLYNMALFLKCGVTITATLESVRDNTANSVTASRIEEIRLGIVQGARMGGLFEASGLFPTFINHLIVAGEEAGNTDEMLLKGAKYMDQEIESAIKMLTAALEPIMTVVIAGVVLFILGSLYLPLMGLMSTNAAG